jgi:hypothetical protein
VVHRGIRAVRSQEVGLSGGAEQQRPAGEHADLLPLGLHGEGQVRIGVTRGGDNPDPQSVADVDDIAVTGRDALVGEPHQLHGPEFGRRALRYDDVCRAFATKSASGKLDGRTNGRVASTTVPCPG